ncbi:MAG: helix-turn-helix domain-containing protein [Polyangiaceae bacterium]
MSAHSKNVNANAVGQMSSAGADRPRDRGDLLDYAEAARFLRLSIHTLYWLVAQRRVPHTRLGPRLVRFSRTALEKWLRDRSVVESGWNHGVSGAS